MVLKDRNILVRTTMIFGLLSVVVLISHGMFYGLSDMSSKNNNGPEIWGWLVTYHIFANIPLLIAILLTHQPKNNQLPKILFPEEVFSAIRSKFGYLFAIALVGLVLHWDAKMRLVDGAFDGCWAGLRAAWLNQTDRGFTLYRIESMMGHLLSSAAYLGVFLSTNVLVTKGRNYRNFLYFAGFVVIGFLYALAIVSRSIMLVLLGNVVVACLLGFISSPIRFSLWAKRSAVIIGFFGCLSFIIAMSLFGNTVKCTEEHLALIEKLKNKSATGSVQMMRPLGAAVISYEDGFIDELPVRRIGKPNELQLLTRQYCSFCNTVFLYLNHGIFNFSEVLASEHRGDHVLFRFAENWGRQLHLLPPAIESGVERVFGRGGVTLPGAAFHDFGGVGVIATALAHGVFILVAIWLLGRLGVACLIGLALYVASGLTMMISGLFVAPALIGFPFVMFSIPVWGGMAVLLNHYGLSRSTINN